ncbi:MAG: D-2-hydroxyacid dehydrogenase family protein [SAR324 cluster bacterium]|nr:D-2-hydroxyacid dehydrogenase family protein [SAR324 cluster bacterium]MCZ6843996.1 D-2-hydroxyacid dehydrogenase family protein [SAR324 cluster bacterium]
MFKIALLDDYQRVAMSSAPWAGLPAQCQVEAFHDFLGEEDALAKRLADFDCVMALRERTLFPRSLLERLPKLKFLPTAGMRNAAIDMEAATELGILVCGTAGISESTAELTWGLILSVLRHIPQEHQLTMQGQWQHTLGVGLKGKTLGLLGLGKIGGMVAAVGKAFGMNLIAWSQNLTDERAAECGAKRVDKDTLCREADVLTIHTVLSDRTRGLLAARELGLMKPTAVLVNSSRGPIVNEQALAAALRNKAIAGAGLDVYGQEPLPKENHFTSLDNVVLTPHLGYVTQEVYQLFYGVTCKNIKNYLAGNYERALNPEVLDKLRPR